MKTNYTKLATEIQTELLSMIKKKSSSLVALDYWDTRMGQCEELDPDFSEDTLRRVLTSIGNPQVN